MVTLCITLRLFFLNNYHLIVCGDHYSDCYNKIPQIRGLIYNRKLFLTVVEAERSRTTKQIASRFGLMAGQTELHQLSRRLLVMSPLGGRGGEWVSSIRTY